MFDDLVDKLFDFVVFLARESAYGIVGALATLALLRKFPSFFEQTIVASVGLLFLFMALIAYAAELVAVKAVQRWPALARGKKE